MFVALATLGKTGNIILIDTPHFLTDWYFTVTEAADSCHSMFQKQFEFTDFIRGKLLLIIYNAVDDRQLQVMEKVFKLGLILF